MRKWLPALVILGVALVGWFFLRQRPSTPSVSASQENAAHQSLNVTPPLPTAPSAKSNSPSSPVNASAVATAPTGYPPEIASATAEVAMPFTAGLPHELEFTNLPPEIVLGKVAHAIRDYASMFGGNPIGTNPEITAALKGQNPRQANFVDPGAGMRINANGEMVDSWGTPYFFHQLSGTEMEIHSAGPDRQMGTADDLVSH